MIQAGILPAGIVDQAVTMDKGKDFFLPLAPHAGISFLLSAQTHF
jgi:hypothetical protein